jgi:hypothetical protein
MNTGNGIKIRLERLLPVAALLTAGFVAMPAMAQAPPAAPPQLDQLVKRIALYPDPLLAQVLTASTFWDVIGEAAAWSNQHSMLHGDQLAAAIEEDHLSWDPSVLALLPFPQVLNMMAGDPGWTQALGNAVLVQRPDVMDAVQRMRQVAYNYHYLASGPYDRVVYAPGAIEIWPVGAMYYVPAYDPLIVFAPPRPGFFIGGAIRFGGGITIGAAFAPFGWRAPLLDWHAHNIMIDNRPWGRTWATRTTYAHPYTVPRARVAGPRVEHHPARREERHER